MASKKLVGHLDADCFYCSAERVRHPHLRRLPVGVLGNQGACVIAKSYEAKAAGITTGMPIWEAVPRCPSAVFVKRDFKWYEVLSRAMLATLKEVSPSVEYYSIDEMFFDASYLPDAFSMPLEQATAALQQRLLERVGVPVSIGVSPSKCLSKLASDARKPFGCTFLQEPGQIQEFLAGLDVDELWGIGRKSAEKLRQNAIHTCLDFVRADRLAIQRLLTIKGEGIWWELRGESVLSLQTSRPAHQRISRGGSLGGATCDPARIQGWLYRNVERLIEELDFHRVRAGRLVLSLAYKDGGGSGRRVTLPQPTADFELLGRCGSALLYEAWDNRSLVSHMHLDAERLEALQQRQMLLFEREKSAQQTASEEVKAKINGQFGRFAIRSAATLPIDDIYADPTNGFDICDIRDKMCF